MKPAMTQRRAVVTGVTGQDGAYLCQFLLEQGYKVFGTFRQSNSPNWWRLVYLGVLGHKDLKLIEFDITDSDAAMSLVREADPDEFYNLAAQSFVDLSFKHPAMTGNVTGLGVVNILEALRRLKPSCRFYQASTSEMFGLVKSFPQNEKTAFHPRSPYGVAKLFAHWMTINYRESYDMFCASGILFNHESPLRGEEFVTRKITSSVAKMHLGLIEKFELGNLDAKRDWGFAGDYVRGMWLMLQADSADTYVLATGKSHTVRNFLSLSLNRVGVDVRFVGNGVEEVVLDNKTGKEIVSINPEYFRPAEVEESLGDPLKAKSELGWEATKDLEEICSEMVEADLIRHAPSGKTS
jgi:GDPmannose 4,6-dehydratase